ncbi:MAG TPA: xanthine dehydrogenase family protein molybdopterin-binding subunit [Candidatus Thermoplasmatota archaeon]|nr:xanthine dehydrogenase family protein molybdopterin-binding subunit [Candidatus Thermoplasmatota archaeon]
MPLDPIPDARKAVVVKEPKLTNWEPYRKPMPKGEHPHYPQNGLKVVGTRKPLVDSPLKVTGEAVYTDDLKFPNMLYAKLLRSRMPHAKIKRIDSSEAEALPGVVAVLTGEGMEGKRFGVLPLTKDEEPLAIDRVRFIGDQVAIVAAEDEWTAIEAVRRIKVEYEPLTDHQDPQKGLKPVKDKIHEGIGIDGSNVQKHVDQIFGDVDAAFAGAAAFSRRSFRFKGVTHAFTEPHAVIAHYSPQGRLTVWSATQVPYYVHRSLAEVTGLPMHRIQVVRPKVGGGFGGKSDPFAHEMAVALLAMKTRRPVKLLFDREESFLSGRHRHPTETEMALGVNADGSLAGLEIQAVIDGGAFASFGIISTYYNGVLSMGPYKVPHFRYRGRRVYTNKVPSGAMRGHGAVNSRCALEILLDETAEQLGMDPIDLRLKNLMEPYSLTVNNFRITSNGLKECLERVRERSGWDQKFRKMPYGRGIGIGCGFYISGSNLPIHWDIEPKRYPQSTVHLKVDMDAGITVHTGAAEIGQGSDTVAAMVVSEVLGVSMDRLRVYSGNSDTAPIDLGSYSSRVTFMMGNAARKAAEDLRDQLQAAAHRLLGGQKENLVFENETIFDLANPTRCVTFNDAVKEAIAGSGALVAKGTFISTPMGGEFKGATAGLAPAYSMSAYVAEVDVDVETGIWRCTKVWAAHDCGKALNPLSVEGQIEGSIHMGLGQVQTEQLDFLKSRLRNPSFLDYKIPTSMEMPEVEVIIVESNDAEGPFGAKEAGEGPLLPILPAVCNAIYDAIGVRLYDLPLTPDKVLNGIERSPKQKPTLTVKVKAPPMAPRMPGGGAE